MLFESIINYEHPALSYIKSLYENTFPLYERREWIKLLSLLSNSKMQLEAILDEQQFIGFVIWWKLDNWLYLEHFAIERQHRGKQYGEKVLRMLISKANNPLILETELPADETASRRIKFYERAGLTTIAFPYFQPPYHKDEQPVPMQLMSTMSNINQRQFNQVVQFIREEVYEKFY